MKIDHKAGRQENRNFKNPLRAICAILGTILLLSACVGCASYASVEEVSALQGELSEAVTEIDSANDDYASALQEIALLKSAYAEAKKRMEELEAAHESTKNALESSIRASKEAVETAKQELDRLTESVRLAQEKIDALQEELRAQKENGDVAQQEIDRLKAQIEDLQNRLPINSGEEKIKIYIDQGHNPTGYHNSGAVGNGLYEQDLTFEIGILLAELLEADGRFEICLSRPTASTVLGENPDESLDARVEGAKNFGADYFISLHINSFSDETVRGIEVHTAEQEGEAYDFGNSLLQALAASTDLRNRGMRGNSELRVLKKATMPAALVEMGFISNADDAALLSEHPELFAEGLYHGILSYFELEPNEPS